MVKRIESFPERNFISDCKYQFVFAEMPITGEGIFVIVPADSRDKAIEEFKNSFLEKLNIQCSVCEMDGETIVSCDDQSFRLLTLNQFVSHGFVSKILEDLYKDQTGDVR